MDPSIDTPNFSALRECLTAPIIRKATLPQKTTKSKSTSAEPRTTDASELSDFIDYLATELWPLLPSRLQEADYNTFLEDASIKDLDKFSLKSVPLSFSESLIGYELVGDDDDVNKLVVAIMEDYVDAVCAPPPVWVETRTEECEICERTVPLTYHHLIPKSTHTKALRRKWHPEHMLNSVAWLCRACHSMVHRCAPNETLAKEFYTVERLLEREDIQKWRTYISKQRWGGRGCKRR